MLGIGLGAFVDGFKGGYGLRQDIDRNNREKKDRDTVVGINTAATKAFDAEVSAGTMKPEQFDEFFQQFALPKLVAERRAAGDLAGANALKAWGETEDAKRGARLSMGAMIKAQTGDAAGALEDAIKAAQINGYLSHGMEIVGQKPVTDAEHGPGFLVTMKGPDGKQVEQFIAEGDVGGVVSRFVNPEAAWESQVAARAKKGERQAELEDFATKEGIKSGFATEKKGPSRKDAYDAMVKAYPPREGLNTGDPGDPGAAGWEDAKQRDFMDKWLRSVDGQITPGTAAAPAPAPKVLVDQNTGQIVTPQASKPAPGAAQQPGIVPQAARMPAAPSAQELGITRKLKPGAVINGVEDPAIPAPDLTPAHQAAPDAATLIQAGGSPEEIARRLMEAGIPQTQWPSQVVMGIVR